MERQVNGRRIPMHCKKHNTPEEGATKGALRSRKEEEGDASENPVELEMNGRLVNRSLRGPNRKKKE